MSSCGRGYEVFFCGLVIVIMSSWGNGMSVEMVLARKAHHGSYEKRMLDFRLQSLCSTFGALWGAAFLHDPPHVATM